MNEVYFNWQKFYEGFIFWKVFTRGIPNRPIRLCGIFGWTNTNSRLRQEGAEGDVGDLDLSLMSRHSLRMYYMKVYTVGREIRIIY